MTGSPDLTSKVMKLPADELKNAEDKITALAQKPVVERLAETLLMLKEYYAYEKDETSLNKTITREEIATLSELQRKQPSGYFQN